MAKITRKTAKQFASSAGGTEVSQFGSFAASSPAYSQDPAVIQSLSNWLGGWVSAIVGNNSPAVEDMNGFCLVMAYQIAYLMQQGVAEWDSGTTYYTGSLASSGGVMYVSLADSNINNAVNDGVHWVVQGGRTRTTAANDNVLITDDVLRANTASGAFTETLPAAATSYGKKVTVANVGSSGNKVTVKGNASENIQSANTYDLNSLESATFFCNGTSWDVL